MSCSCCYDHENHLLVFFRVLLVTVVFLVLLVLKVLLETLDAQESLASQEPE